MSTDKQVRKLMEAAQEAAQEAAKGGSGDIKVSRELMDFVYKYVNLIANEARDKPQPTGFLIDALNSIYATLLFSLLTEYEYKVSPGEVRSNAIRSIAPIIELLEAVLEQADEVAERSKRRHN